MSTGQTMPDGDTLLPFVMLFYGRRPFGQIQFSQSMFGHLFSLFFELKAGKKSLTKSNKKAATAVTCGLGPRRGRSDAA